MELLRLRNTEFRNLLGFIIFIELFAFGSGQILLIFGGLTLRIVNFFLMLFIGSLLVLKRKSIPKDIAVIFLYYCVILIYSIIIGYINGGGENIVIDIKSLSYFLSILFIFFYIKNIESVIQVKELFKKVSLIISVIYVLYILLLNFSFYDFDDIYNLLHNFSDFRYRGITGILFYKGFVYLPIALLFYNLDKGVLSIQSTLLATAIFFTQTRGFWVMAILAYILSGLYILNKNYFKVSIVKLFIFTLAFLAVFIFIFISFAGLDGNRTGGDSVRIQTIMQVVERITFFSFFMGHGFGVGVPLREVHMEMSYLEIFHKQGVLGLGIWIYILFDSVKIIFRLKQNVLVGIGYCFGIFLMYVQSLFNPYITNSMGIGFVVIAYVSMKRLELVEQKGGITI